MPTDSQMPPGGVHIRWPDTRAGAGGAPVRLQVVRRAGLHPRQPPELQRRSKARTTASASSPAARPTTTRARPCSTWAWTTPPAASSASACTRSAWSGRWRRRARASSRPACARSWWWRKSARSSSTSSRKSSTTGAPTCGPTCSASSTKSKAISRAANGRMPNPTANTLLRANADLSPALIARAIAQRLKKLGLRRATWRRASMRSWPSWRPRSARCRCWRSRATAQPWFCSGCPHNTSHRGARRLARHGRHRLPLHGDLDGPRHRRLHADGRRGRAVGRPAAVHHRQAHVRQPGRRHLLPQRPAGDPPVASRPA